MPNKGRLPSERQVMAMVSLAFISPAVRLLPQRTSAVAGAAAWTAPLLALLPVLAVSLLVRKMAPRGDLSGAMIRAFGSKLGRGVLMLYALWAAALAALCLRFYGERFLTTAYPEARIEIFIAAMALLLFLVLRKNVLTFARACEVYFLLIAVLLGLLLAFAAKDVRPEEIFTVSILDAPGVLRALWPICSVCATLIFASFIKREKGSGKIFCGFTAGVLVVFALMNAIIIGVFSAPFVEKLQVPFFTLVKNIEVLRVFERVDALVLAWFVLTDLAFAGLMLFMAASVGRTVFRFKAPKVLAPGLAIAVFVLALLPKDGFQAELITEKIVHPVNIFLGFFLPIVTALILKLRFGRICPQNVAMDAVLPPQDIEMKKKYEKNEKMC